MQDSVIVTRSSSVSAERHPCRPRLAQRGDFIGHTVDSPDWQLSADQQEILDEALVWACKSGRTEVLGRLLRAGARLDADPYRGTPLIWSAFCNRMETAACLLDHGAAVNQKATFGGLTHGRGVTALHMASQKGHLSMVKLLINRGADPSITDDLHGEDAAGHANFLGHADVRDYLHTLGGRMSGI